MLRELPDMQFQHTAAARRRARSFLIQATLWGVWALTVVGFAYMHWYTDIVAQRADNLLSLAIHTLLFGLVGMIISTRIEMWLDPERFIASGPRR